MTKSSIQTSLGEEVRRKRKVRRKRGREKSALDQAEDTELLMVTRLNVFLSARPFLPSGSGKVRKLERQVQPLTSFLNLLVSLMFLQ